MSAGWIRVTRQNPCPCCGHPDWCAIGERWINCMRLASAHPVKNGGWLHPLGTAAMKVAPKPVEEAHHINATAIMRDFAADTTRDMLAVLAKRLSVSVESLIQLGAAWAAPHNAWAFPMKDEHGNVIGVRLRSDSGKKWAVSGSRAGLFYWRVEHDRLTCICEGPTDTAAALSIGLHAVGRPSCVGQEEMLRSILRHARRVLILSDNDDPGLNGATKLRITTTVIRMMTLKYYATIATGQLLANRADFVEIIYAQCALKWAEGSVEKTIRKSRLTLTRMKHIRQSLLLKNNNANARAKLVVIWWL
jgi:hypothetical protein